LTKLKKNMLKKLLFIGSISLFAVSCSANMTNVNSNANVTSNSANAVVNAANTANTGIIANPVNVQTSANRTAVKPAASGTKRIAFAAGKSEGNESIALAAGESKKFVVGAKTGQIFMVDADSKDVKISLIKGKVATNATSEEPGHYDTTLLENGDFVFEVKNTSKKELKTSMKVIISHTDISH